MNTSLTITPKNLYKYDDEILLVMSVVEGIVICVNVKSNGNEKNWALVKEQDFKEKAVLIGELMKQGTYINAEGRRISSGFGPVVLCEIIVNGTPQTLLLYEAFNYFYGTPPVLKHISGKHDS